LFVDDTTWAKTAVTDLKHLDEKVKNQRRFSKTLKNVTDLATLGTVNTVSQLSKAYLKQVNKYTEHLYKSEQVEYSVVRFSINNTQHRDVTPVE
jgi:5-bromo-4-chloroindolyl phosphate hydrolysis protein